MQQLRQTSKVTQRDLEREKQRALKLQGEVTQLELMRVRGGGGWWGMDVGG